MIKTITGRCLTVIKDNSGLETLEHAVFAAAFLLITSASSPPMMIGHGSTPPTKMACSAIWRTAGAYTWPRTRATFFD
jgi:hypothetical protein